jgi:hypothetical protein
MLRESLKEFQEVHALHSGAPGEAQAACGAPSWIDASAVHS